MLQKSKKIKEIIEYWKKGRKEQQNVLELIK